MSACGVVRIVGPYQSGRERKGPRGRKIAEHRMIALRFHPERLKTRRKVVMAVVVSQGVVDGPSGLLRREAIVERRVAGHGPTR